MKQRAYPGTWLLIIFELRFARLPSLVSHTAIGLLLVYYSSYPLLACSQQLPKKLIVVLESFQASCWFNSYWTAHVDRPALLWLAYCIHILMKKPLIVCTILLMHVNTKLHADNMHQGITTYVNRDDEMLTVQKSYGLQVVCMQLMLLMTHNPHNPQNAHIMLHTHKCVIHAFIH